MQEHTRVVRFWAAASECQYGRVVSSIRGVGLEGPTSWKLPVWLVDARRRSGGVSGLEAVKHNGSWAELTLAQSYGFSAYAAIGMGHRILSIVAVLVRTFTSPPIARLSRDSVARRPHEQLPRRLGRPYGVAAPHGSAGCGMHCGWRLGMYVASDVEEGECCC